MCLSFIFLLNSSCGQQGGTPPSYFQRQIQSTSNISQSLDPWEEVDSPTSYREAMRSLVIKISERAKAQNPNFLIIPNQGLELLATDDDITTPNTDYLNAIDGVQLESVFWTWSLDGSGQITYVSSTTSLVVVDNFISMVQDLNKPVFSVDFTDDGDTENTVRRATSVTSNTNRSYLSFQGNFALDKIPSSINGENATNITTLANAQNFLPLYNPSGYGIEDGSVYSARKVRLINLLAATNYDVIFTYPFYRAYNSTTQTIDYLDWMTAANVQSLKAKQNGGTRMVIAYLNIGAASPREFYWSSYELSATSPYPWLGTYDSLRGIYEVEYWHPFWEKIIVANPDSTGGDSYLDRILEAGFDGVLLDMTNQYKQWESL